MTTEFVKEEIKNADWDVASAFINFKHFSVWYLKGIEFTKYVTADFMLYESIY